MQHSIPVETLGPLGSAMAGAVEQCVHCGFCLPACPTYTVMAEEMDSPRGRIILMKSVLEGEIKLDEALPYIDRCLGRAAGQAAARALAGGARQPDGAVAARAALLPAIASRVPGPGAAPGAG